MRGLLTLLLYAGFFYLMMRFGCGAHKAHGHGGCHDQGVEGVGKGTRDSNSDHKAGDLNVVQVK